MGRKKTEFYSIHYEKSKKSEMINMGEKELMQKLDNISYTVGRVENQLNQIEKPFEPHVQQSLIWAGTLVIIGLLVLWITWVAHN